MLTSGKIQPLKQEKFNYVQLNSNNIVIGISSLGEKIEQIEMVELKEYDTTLLGKKYDETTETFIEVPKTREEIAQDKLDKLKKYYLSAIQEAKDLGDAEEIARLQAEYKKKKTTLEM